MIANKIIFLCVGWIICFAHSATADLSDRFDRGVRYKHIQDLDDSIQRVELCRTATNSELVKYGNCLAGGLLSCRCRCNSSLPLEFSLKYFDNCTCPDIYYPNAHTLLWTKMTLGKQDNVTEEQENDNITSSGEDYITENDNTTGSGEDYIIIESSEIEVKIPTSRKNVTWTWVRISPEGSGDLEEPSEEDKEEEEVDPDCTLYFKINCFQVKSQLCEFDQLDMLHLQNFNWELEYTRDSMVFSVNSRKGCYVTRYVNKTICQQEVPSKTIYESGANLLDSYSITAAKYSCHCGPLGDITAEDYQRRITGIITLYGVVTIATLFVLVTVHVKSWRQDYKIKKKEGEKVLVLGGSSFYTGVSLISTHSTIWKSCPHGLKLVSEDALGRGYFGDVWKAQDLEEAVAVKRIYMYRALVYFKWDASRLLREIENLSLIQNEHVVQFHTYWIEGPFGFVEDISQLSILDWTSTRVEYFLFVQMELCDYTLEKWLQGDECQELLVDKDVREMFLQIARGLQAIHSQNIIHRDIKPNNIFCKVSSDSGPKWKIGDLGLSRKVESDSNETTEDSAIDRDSNFSQVGCASYRSPEMVQGLEYTNKADVYSMGLVFFEIFSPTSLKTYWEKSEMFDQIRATKFESLYALLFGEAKFRMYSTNLLQLVVGMLEPNPKLRYDANSVIRILEVQSSLD